MRRLLSDWMFHVVVAWGIIFAICLASPAKAKTWPTHDAWGNPFPAACQKDMSDVPVFVTFQHHLGHSVDGRKTMGYFLPSQRKGVPPTILVDASVTDHKLQDDILRHEQCHAVMWYLTGDFRWHR